MHTGVLFSSLILNPHCILYKLASVSVYFLYLIFLCLVLPVFRRYIQEYDSQPFYKDVIPGSLNYPILQSDRVLVSHTILTGWKLYTFLKRI